MKNTTKKILSMLLAVIMLLSVMPVAYAERATYSPEVEQYIDFMIKIESYRGNIYVSETDYNKIWDIFSNAYNNEFGNVDSDEIDLPLGESLEYVKYDDINNVELDIKAFSRFNEFLQATTDEIDAKIASGEIGVIINIYEYLKFLGTLEAYYDMDVIDEVYFGALSSDSEIAQNFIKAESTYNFEDPKNIQNQAEYDVAVDTIARPFFDMLTNCLDGNHPYGEYISNGDATEETDGTKTATCEFCGATDTIVDEGSKLDNNDNSKCSCNCHKKGIMAFIWKILNFFYKIFGMNKTCGCGVAHY